MDFKLLMALRESLYTLDGFFVFSVVNFGIIKELAGDKKCLKLLLLEQVALCFPVN